MIYIRPFKKEDLTGLVTIEKDIVEFSDELIEAIEDSGLAVTGTRDGRVVGCGGIHPANKEHGFLWIRLSEDCKQYKIEMVRCLRKVLEIFEKMFPFKQLDALVKCDFKESIKLVESFGFIHTQVKDGWNIYSKRII